ncbi:unnamed protein product [Cuscuta campestris]|uniref:F-box/LRR-repeat protein 15-like leucin rich repeat domain-containing protein n=1 Tax=Cuscuta campestris TaxID=132261 RepID=A0A484MSX0_9ASTE|nr:unnamed protein product [Cuscuta campestris]
MLIFFLKMSGNRSRDCDAERVSGATMAGPSTASRREDARGCDGGAFDGGGCGSIIGSGTEASAVTVQKGQRRPASAVVDGAFPVGVYRVERTRGKLLHVLQGGCFSLIRADYVIQNITDQALLLIADNYQEIDSLNITRCIKLTHSGLQRMLLKCSFLQRLNLYALSTFTDEAYKKISLLPHLKFLDLCGAQNLTDDGLSCIANCRRLLSLNLTWCVRVTDLGIKAIARGCMSLEFLSLFGIVGVTDKSLEALSSFCSSTLTTLDVNGCIGIKNRRRNQLLEMFPNLKCFKVHS